MPGNCADNFIIPLADLLAEEPLREKWLLAPSIRIGYQWLDRVARSGQPVFNTRIKIIRALAIEIAGPLLEKKEKTYIGAEPSKLVVAGLLKSAPQGEASYFGGLERSWRLIQVIHRALIDMRLAGLSCGDLNSGSFEVEAKGRELVRLLEGYERKLNEGGYVDYPGALGLAIGELSQGGGKAVLPENLLLTVPGDLPRSLRGLEAAFAGVLLESSGVILKTGVSRGGEHKICDAGLLKFLLEPSKAPEPAGDGTASIFRAAGEINEVREVFRRCARDRIPLDDAELLYTDCSTYVPLIFEEAAGMAAGDFASIPVTLFEGVPVMFSRPARALFAFVSWIFEGYPQETAARMIQEGLLEFGDIKAEHSRLAAMLRTLPIGEGLYRYKDALDEKIEYLRDRASQATASDILPGENDVRDEGVEQPPEAQLENWTAILGAVEKLSEAAKLFSKGGTGPLEGSLLFLKGSARSKDELDEYSRVSLVKSIKTLIETVAAHGGAGDIDFTEWLTGLLRTTSVEGKGPRPGCLYAAPLHAGGHSGRGHTFIIGLDDTRFPGPGIQDPVLLDAERGSISAELKHSGMRPVEKMEELQRLLSRIEGKVTLGYCCRKLDDDRKLFPGPAVLAAYRIISGNRDGDQGDLEKWLGDPVSFAPGLQEECLGVADYWLYLICLDAVISEPENLIASVYPHLRRGFTARDARAGNRFTEYDGNVPEAGADACITGENGKPVSPTRLETLGRCPMDYFFKHVLEVKVPEVYEHDPTRWLGPLETGSLLHEVFREFMEMLIDEGRPPEFDRDLPRLNYILGSAIDGLKSRKPPQRTDVFDREVRDLERACTIFLREEVEYCRRSTPRWCEASIGLRADAEGTGLDTEQPVSIELPGGAVINVHGQIDRIDELSGTGGGYAVFDYKTGSDYNYDESDPHRSGRLIQNALYMELAERRLREIDPDARAELFGYFFPGTRAHGERYEWTRAELKDGLRYVELLCEMLTKGCFIPSDEENDMSFSDYKEAFGDTAEASENTKRKMKNPDNEALEPFRKLRE
ncbi:MAG: PD-(D/E)XK nuclease family protein [Actinobacteria bacterium]|nr:PD-(D/E)XK nuclease family protein [Actinomycetota bacterium]